MSLILVTAIPTDPDRPREPVLVNSAHVHFIHRDDETGGSVIALTNARGDREMILVVESLAEISLREATARAGLSPERITTRLDERVDELEMTLSDWIGDLGERVDLLRSHVAP